MSNKNYPLHLLHIGDTHSYFDPAWVNFSLQAKHQTYTLKCSSGGYARLQTQIKAFKQHHADMPSLFLHGGDLFQGSLYYNCFGEEANARLINLLSPDAIVLGNHDIDDGSAVLRPFLDQLDCPMLAGNMDTSAEAVNKKYPLADHPQLYAYDAKQQRAQVILQPFHDTQLAIFGITLDNMHQVAKADDDLLFHDAIEVAQQTVAYLKKNHIHHIVVISHLGLHADRRLAEQVPGISLIVGGHSHSLQGDFQTLGINTVLPYGETVSGVPIFHAGKHTEVLGSSQLMLDESGRVKDIKGGNWWLLSSDLRREIRDQIQAPETQALLLQQLSQHPQVLLVEAHPEIETLLATHYRPIMTEMSQQIIVHLDKSILHTRLPSQHLPEGSQLTPLVAQSFYEYARNQQSISLDFSLHNAGCVRASLYQGQVSYADMLGSVLPFNKPIVCFKIQGKWLKRAIEGAIDNAYHRHPKSTGTGSYPYAYLLKWTYHHDAPALRRLTDVWIWQNQQWCPVLDDSLYQGACSDYTLSGKEGYTALQHATDHIYLDKLMTDIFIDWLKNYQSKASLALESAQELTA
ncbi:MAG: bifunctional metallophosphatase/5'-nucleotidase [Shewanellaceae bacterium]|nr:bifunctional metallophosphatase/5'-nucleotidase [Shewanellaceae bacterium]